MTDTEILERLHRLAHWLGSDDNDYAILAEGNVSAAIDDGPKTFWLKASGCRMGTMRPDQFVRMDTARALALLQQGNASDAEIQRALLAAKADSDDPKQPSVEAALHAVCLTDGGARVVGHTHPTAWLSVLCSQKAEEALAGRLFPDEIVVCGPAPCYVPYVDPGPPLARAAQASIRAYVEIWGETPKVLLLQNHGLFALGKDADEVERVTRMSVKVARALLGTFALGGPRFLSPEEADRIKTRPDEELRRRMLSSGTVR